MIRLSFVFAVCSILLAGCQGSQQTADDIVTSYKVRIAPVTFPYGAMDHGYDNFWPTPDKVMSPDDFESKLDDLEAVTWLLKHEGNFGTLPDSFKKETLEETAKVVKEGFQITRDGEDASLYQFELNLPGFNPSQEFQLLERFVYGTQARLIEQGKVMREAKLAELKTQSDELESQLAVKQEKFSELFQDRNAFDELWAAVQELRTQKNGQILLQGYIGGAEKWCTQKNTMTSFNAIQKLTGKVVSKLRQLTGEDTQFHSMFVKSNENLESMRDGAKKWTGTFESNVKAKQEVVNGLITSEDADLLAKRKTALAEYLESSDAEMRSQLLSIEAGDQGWMVYRFDMDSESYMEAQSKSRQ